MILALSIAVSVVLVQDDPIEALRAKFEAERSHPAVRRVATLTAAAAFDSDPAVEFLAEVFDKETDEAVRAGAVKALATCSVEPAVEKLVAIGRDVDEKLPHRSTALRSLMEGQRDEGLALARKVFREPGDLRWDAYLLLHYYPLKKTEVLWRAALDDLEPFLRGRALLMLAPLKDARLINRSRASLENRFAEPYEQYGAVEVCRVAGGPAIAQLFLKLAITDDPVLFDLLASALGTLEDAASAKLIFTSLRNRIPRIREMAARSLGSLPHAEAMRRLTGPLRDKNAAVKAAALEAVAERKDPGSEKILRREATRADADLSAVAIGLLSNYPSEDTIKLLLKLATAYKTTTSIPALDALAEMKTPEALPAYRKAIQNRQWPVRVCAIRGLGSIKDKEAIDLLVARMEREHGRLLAECVGSLQLLTGKQLGPVARSWKAWWEANRETFTFTEGGPAAKGKGGGTAGTTTYYGVPILSDRIVFCLDRSGSMSAPSGKGNRLDQAKEKLIEVLSALGKEAKVNVIFFDDQVIRWQNSLVSIKTNLRRALRLVSTVEPRGSTNIFDTLDVAFQDSDVDTIYLLSDGGPTDGKFIDPLDILREIRRRNRFRKIVIHTISVGASPLMKALAESNDGRYVEIED